MPFQIERYLLKFRRPDWYIDWTCVSDIFFKKSYIHTWVYDKYILNSYQSAYICRVVPLFFNTRAPHHSACCVNTRGPLCRHGLTLIQARISNGINYNACDEINHPFLNFNGASVGGYEWIVNFIPHFTGHVITYPCRDWIKFILVKWPPVFLTGNIIWIYSISQVSPGLIVLIQVRVHRAGMLSYKLRHILLPRSFMECRYMGLVNRHCLVILMFLLVKYQSTECLQCSSDNRHLMHHTIDYISLSDVLGHLMDSHKQPQQKVYFLSPTSWG